MSKAEGKDFHFGTVGVPEWNGLEGESPMSRIPTQACSAPFETRISAAQAAISSLAFLSRLKPRPAK
jgi:hypothetical protein